jgi:c-di-AMP phosphodiesterase-like protein
MAGKEINKVLKRWVYRSVAQLIIGFMLLTMACFYMERGLYMILVYLVSFIVICDAIPALLNRKKNSQMFNDLEKLTKTIDQLNETAFQMEQEAENLRQLAEELQVEPLPDQQKQPN